MTQIQDISNESLDKYLQNGIPDYYLAFLTTPQHCLVLFNKARNKLLGLLKSQLVVIDTLIESLSFIKSFEQPIQESLTNLKIPLVQFDTSGNLKNLDKYKSKVTKFLDTLPLKSGSSQTFAKTAIDSQEDIYAALQTYLTIQKDVGTLLANIQAFEIQLQGVDIYKAVVKGTASLARGEIDNLDQQKNEISKIALATDLLASTAVLEYFKSLGPLFDGIYKPVVSNTIPASEEIYGYPETLSAIAISAPSPQTTTHQDFKVTIDGIPHSIDFPSTAAKGRSYLLSIQTAGSYMIPVNTRLYVKITCPVLPNSRVLPEGPTSPIGTVAIDLPSGSQTPSSISSAITTGLNVFDTGLALVQFGFCDEFAIAGSNRLLIYGKSDVTELEIVTPPGLWTGTYHAAYPTCTELGFGYTKSAPVNLPSYDDLLACLNYYFPVTKILNTLRIQSPTTGPNSSLVFPTSISTDIGFLEAHPQPTFIQLKSRGMIQNLKQLNLYTGCTYKDTLGNSCAFTVNGDTILLPIPIPNVGKLTLELFPDLVSVVKSSLLVAKGIQPYSTKLEEIWLPVLNSPSDLQIILAKNYILQVQATIQAIIFSLTKEVKASVFIQATNSLLNQLDSKGLSKLVMNLNTLDFTSFFAAQMNDTSFGLDVMSKIEALNG